MQHLLRAGVISLALLAMAWAQGQPAAGPRGATAVPASTSPPVTIPVWTVVLFSSGVGYFEHAGSVMGQGSTELR